MCSIDWILSLRQMQRNCKFWFCRRKMDHKHTVSLHWYSFNYSHNYEQHNSCHRYCRHLHFFYFKLFLFLHSIDISVTGQLSLVNNFRKKIFFFLSRTMFRLRCLNGKWYLFTGWASLKSKKNPTAQWCSYAIPSNRTTSLVSHIAHRHTRTHTHPKDRLFFLSSRSSLCSHLISVNDGRQSNVCSWEKPMLITLCHFFAIWFHSISCASLLIFYFVRSFVLLFIALEVLQHVEPHSTKISVMSSRMRS